MFAAATLCLAIVSNAAAATTDAETVHQSARQIPLVRQTDVLVVGGTLGAVAAAVEAAESEASVLLVAPRTYLGEDLCATLNLWQEKLDPKNRPVSKTVQSDYLRIGFFSILVISGGKINKKSPVSIEYFTEKRRFLNYRLTSGNNIIFFHMGQ